MEGSGALRHVTLCGAEKTGIGDTRGVERHARFVFICRFSQGPQPHTHLQSLSTPATLLFISSRELREILFVYLWGVSPLMWIARHGGTTSGKAGEKTLCGPRRWQVQKVCARVWVRTHVRACAGWCVGAGESRGLHRKVGEEILSGKAKWRMWIGMLCDSCKWEERYGAQRTHDIPTCRCQKCLWLCFVDVWACVLVVYVANYLRGFSFSATTRISSGMGN